jgi:hypothetical protein
MTDDKFTSLGVTWRRIWTGPEGYRWRSECGRLTAWRFRNQYRCAVDNRQHGERWATLKQAMDAAARQLARASEVAA